MAKRKREMPAAKAKTHFLSLLDEVAKTGEEIFVTKRGKVVAKLAPAKEFDWRSLRGSVLYEADDIITPDEEWDMEKDEEWHDKK